MDSVEAYKLDTKLSFSELIVPTADSICYTFLLDQVCVNQHVISHISCNVLMYEPS